MASATLRQWHLLSLLPKGPRRIDSATLAARLRERGFVVHHRTVQRDLVELAHVFPIVKDHRSKPYGWRWSDDGALLCSCLQAVFAIYHRRACPITETPSPGS